MVRKRDYDFLIGAIAMLAITCAGIAVITYLFTNTMKWIAIPVVMFVVLSVVAYLYDVWNYKKKVEMDIITQNYQLEAQQRIDSEPYRGMGSYRK
jgi:type III secretory pathway component EscU